MMNKWIITLVALVAFVFVAFIAFAASAMPACAETETIEVRGEVVDAASQIAPFTWTGQNFAGLYYDVDRNLMSDSLTTTVALPNTIEGGSLRYTAYRVKNEYANPEIGDYFATGWFGGKCMAINAKPYILSPILLEMGEHDKKTLVVGDEWHLGNGYSLNASEIDIEGNNVTLSLNKDGFEVKSAVIRTEGHAGGQGCDFDNSMDISGSLGAYTFTVEDIQTSRTFVYQKDIDFENDVPIFSVYVNAVFRGTYTDLVQFKYAILIDDDLINVISEGAGVLDIQMVTPEWIRLDNDESITLARGSDIRIAEGLEFHVANDLDGDGVSNYRYYPCIRHVCPAPEPCPTPTPTPTLPYVEEIVEICGEVAEPTSAQPGVLAWDAYNFAAFSYDLDRDAANEILMISPGTLSEYDRTIDEDDLMYVTTAVDADFDCSRWGSYRAIDFIAVEYFAGYGNGTDDEITDDDANLIANGMLSRVLIDEEMNRVISTCAPLQLEDGYELKLVQIVANGTQAQLELTRYGRLVPTGTIIVEAPDTFVYTKDMGSVDDVPIIAVHISGIFVGTETDVVAIDGIFQISEEYTSVKTGNGYGKMEVVSISGNMIRMENYDDITLSEGCVIDLMGRIKLAVAENETLRFAPVVEFVEPGTYEVRGAVQSLNGNQGDEITWDAQNSAFLWYDLDSDAATETLKIIPDTLSGDWTIEEGRLYYVTHPVYQEYELHEDWGLTVDGDSGYMAEGWMGDQYITVGGRADRLCRPLVEFEDCEKKTLATGEAWNLGGGFTLTAQQIDLEGGKVWFSLARDGDALDDEVISYSPGGDCQDRVYTYTEDIDGTSDVPVFSCYVAAMFRGTDSNLVQVKYVFLIDNCPLRINYSDRFGCMVATTVSYGEVVLWNNETINLDVGTTAEITDNMYFRTADDSVLRFYPFIEHTINGYGDVPLVDNEQPTVDEPPVDDAYIFDNGLQVNEGIEIELGCD
jgi:S-layer protein (TIGR01567 family)